MGSTPGKDCEEGTEGTEGTAVCTQQEDPSSLLALRLAREARSSERILKLLSFIMQDLKIALDIGTVAGIPATFHYGATAREHGAAMREVLPRLCAAAVPDLYVCGGASMFQGVLHAVSRFSFSHGIWEPMPPMPTARRLCAAATVGSSMYVLGGECMDSWLWYETNVWKQYRQLKTTERFDAFAGTWHAVEDMLTARAGCAAASHGGLVYAFGGRISEDVHNAVECLYTEAGSWSHVPNLPTGRSGCAAASLCGMLYVVGGKGVAGQILDTAEVFDPDRGCWHILPPLPTPRSACGCSAVAGKVLAAGGFNGSFGLETVDAFDPATEYWEAVVPMQAWRIGAASVCTGGKLYLLGGKTASDRAPTCECFDLATGIWSSLPAMPDRHVYCAGAAVLGF